MPRQPATIIEHDAGRELGRLQMPNGHTEFFSRENCLACEFHDLVAGQAVYVTPEVLTGPSPTPLRIWAQPEPPAKKTE